MFKAILFDRDGVLLDSEQIHIDSVAETLRKFGVEITEEEKKKLPSRNPKDYVKEFAGRYNFPEKEFLELQRGNYIKLFRNSDLITPPEILSVLKSLKEEKYIFGLTTSSDEITTEIFLKKMGIRDLFNGIVTVDECEKRKPNPLPYLLTANKLGVSPRDCVVIEDSETGLISAKRAGMKCIIIPNKHTDSHDFSNADAVVSSFEDILKELRRLNEK